MLIPTEPIGSIPRPSALLDVLKRYRNGNASAHELNESYDAAIKDTVQRFEETGSPVITDGEQRKSSFATYPLEGLTNIADDGIVIPFEDGHNRQLPRLTHGPFRYGRYAVNYLQSALHEAHRPVKQAVISASALSLLYPQQELAGYSREAFLNDVVKEVSGDISLCLDAGAHCVQIDFTEGRLAVKLDPSKALLKGFIALNNRVLEQFNSEQRKSIGVHTCPGGDRDSTHSADVDYAELLPELFRLKAGNFYVQLASEKDPRRVLAIIRENLQPDQRVFVGVIDVIDNRVETPEIVRDRVLLAAEYIPLAQLGTTDDCGFSPFEDDTSTGRDIAFAKIHARVLGTQMAADLLQAQNRNAS
ncbi:MAG: cobalamin-independent methionine synthase II family protein [Methylobacter sp.]|uniref:cobalamin-independent methionine synthase II family protein n=1 Tax=Methylobacter sp. TaxID=2051955 RepID=UPI00258294A3|nr:cobalamin-independent methionine synthase II family protein [Methylobacter sp.]MCL7419746.1 cobalamin-independent methionine synthase II family protein [Methylobacter sp.]